MSAAAPHILFVPGGGGAGSGETFRDLMLAKAARERWQRARIGFLTSEDHRDVGIAPFERHVVPGRVARNVAAVLAILERERPDVVVFDNRGSTAAIVAAARLGAKVVFVADSAQILHRVFRMRRLQSLSQLWLVQRRLGPEAPTLSGPQRLRLALARGPRVLFFDALFPEADAERRARLRSELGLGPGPYALFFPGGGGTSHGGRPAPEIFAEAAARVHEATGITCVAVMGPLYDGALRDPPGVTVVASLAPERAIDLLSGAEIVACGGGVTSVQALALGRLCVVADTGGRDQAERLRAGAEAGLLKPTRLDEAEIASRVVALLRDAEAREAMRRAVAACDMQNGLSRALDSLATLIDPT